ncbi:hypothetical protein K438DRAFT_1751497 [Mycena galopus ATCC 62051]|nr:hypothetical protein K438DRAFT_1751497 [Mycena galopus ATCC 62051]
MSFFTASQSDSQLQLAQLQKFMKFFKQEPNHYAITIFELQKRLDSWDRLSTAERAAEVEKFLVKYRDARGPSGAWFSAPLKIFSKSTRAVKSAEATINIDWQTAPPAAGGLHFTSIQASLDAVHNTLRVVLSRTSASTGSAPPAPTAAEAVVINANGKRVHDADGVDDAAKRQHLAITAPTPFSLPTAPPPPGYAAPAFAAPAPLLPAPFVPAAAAPMPALIAPAPVPAHPFAVATIAPTALPTVPAPLPRAPPAGAPRVPPNPAREVLFGPMNWEKKWNRNPHNLIMNTLGPTTMRGVHFSSRRGADDDTVIVVFEAETVANWFVTTWNASSRLGYEICTARPQSLNV